MKITTKQVGAIGLIMMMIATAYIIPFPTELLTYLISTYVLGGMTVANIKISVLYLWVVGAAVFIGGYILYIRSGNHVTLRKNKESKK